MIDPLPMLSTLKSTLDSSQKMQQSMQEAILSQVAGKKATTTPGAAMSSSLTGIFDQLNSQLKQALAAMGQDPAETKDENLASSDDKPASMPPAV